MVDRTGLRSQALDLLRFPLAVVIVCVHVFSDSFTLHGTVYSFDDMPVFKEVYYFISAFLKGQSVPIYFFISGYVFFLGGEFTKEVYARKLKNRVKTLLIPYIIWNTVAILMQLALFLPVFSSILPGISKVELDWSLPAVLQCYWNASKGIFAWYGSEIAMPYPQDMPLWFLHELMIMAICSPLIHRLLKWGRSYIMMLFGVFWFVQTYWGLNLSMLAEALFFFSWGAYMSICGKDMLAEFGRFFKVSAILYILLGVAYMVAVHRSPETADLLKRFNVVAGLFFAYNVSAWILRHNVCKVSPFLSASSFFIYVTHMLICNNILKLCFLIVSPVNQWGVVSLYMLAIVATLAVTLVAFYLLRRYTPGLLRVITGRK